MNINDLTIGEAKQLAAMFGGGEVYTSPHLGKRCVVRTYASGVHFGTLLSQHGRQVELKDARRLWYWKAKEGISLSEIATFGVKPDSKICSVVPAMTITDALEIIPASEKAAESIDSQKVYQP